MPLPAILLGGSLAALGTTLLRYLTVYFITKLLFALGIVAFSIIGSELVVNYIETEVQNWLGTVPGALSQILLMSGLGEAVQIIFNCWVIAINIRSLKGAFKGFKFS